MHKSKLDFLPFHAISSMSLLFILFSHSLSLPSASLNGRFKYLLNCFRFVAAFNFSQFHLFPLFLCICLILICSSQIEREKEIEQEQKGQRTNESQEKTTSEINFRDEFSCELHFLSPTIFAQRIILADAVVRFFSVHTSSQ